MKCVVALGGNAILRRGERGTAGEQRIHVYAAVSHIADMISQGYRIVITHGNGPQVGDILIKEECASALLPRMPLDICGAESQGMIGYMIQQTLQEQLGAGGIKRPVLTVITQTLVDPDDPAFHKPEKPIGPYYKKEEADSLTREKGWHFHRMGDGESGYRRVVPSPAPLKIVEDASVRTLFEEGFVVIAAGGGGIPVHITENGELRGVEAVIDKDLAAEKLAAAISADILLILTDVEYVYQDYGTPDQRPMTHLSVAEARAMHERGDFTEGTMAPKIEACARFIESGGKRAIITSLDRALDALEGDGGTQITASDQEREMTHVIQ